MVLQRRIVTISILLIATIILSGCANGVKFKRKPKEYPYPEIEPEWIRGGEPIVFEGETWYPTDNVELLLDSEVYVVDTYQDVQVFVEKIDVRPYDRLYTKFNKNKFRFYQRAQ